MTLIAQTSDIIFIRSSNNTGTVDLLSWQSNRYFHNSHEVCWTVAASMFVALLSSNFPGRVHLWCCIVHLTYGNSHTSHTTCKCKPNDWNREHVSNTIDIEKLNWLRKFSPMPPRTIELKLVAKLNFVALIDVFHSVHIWISFIEEKNIFIANTNVEGVCVCVCGVGGTRALKTSLGKVFFRFRKRILLSSILTSQLHTWERIFPIENCAHHKSNSIWKFIFRVPVCLFPWRKVETNQ